MSARPDRRQAGTRVRLYPQAPFLDPGHEPEVVTLSLPAGSVGPGPQDERIYTVFPVDKTMAYGRWVAPDGSLHPYLPPWDGPVLPPAEPDREGHFDHLEPGTPQFEAAHLYGTTRYVLDIWERYVGGPIPWHFAAEFERLELSILHDVDNAFMGYGFLEAGANVTDDGELRPYSLNFDVVAHEVGHALIYSMLGVPDPEAAQGEYFGLHESAGDAAVLVSTLHFESVVDELLEGSHGNLYTFNHLNRLAELTETTQIRLASNDRRLSEFQAGWRDEHDLALPLTGAIFDILVDIYHENLLDGGLISPAAEDLADLVEDRPELTDLMQQDFDRAYARDPLGFKETLLDARDRMGFYLAAVWDRLEPDFLTFEDVGGTLLEVDLEASGGRYARLIERNLLRRDIGLVRVGPRLPKLEKEDEDGKGSLRDALLDRTAPPERPRHLPRRYRDRVLRSGAGMRITPWFR